MNEQLRLRKPRAVLAAFTVLRAQKAQPMWECWLMLFRPWGPLHQGTGGAYKLQDPCGQHITSFTAESWDCDVVQLVKPSMHEALGSIPSTP